MRRIFQYLNDVEKREALDEVRRDIEELEKESQKLDYPGLLENLWVDPVV